RIASSPPWRGVKAGRACPMRNAAFRRIRSSPPRRAARGGRPVMAVAPAVLEPMPTRRRRRIANTHRADPERSRAEVPRFPFYRGLQGCGPNAVVPPGFVRVAGGSPWWAVHLWTCKVCRSLAEVTDALALEVPVKPQPGPIFKGCPEFT